MRRPLPGLRLALAAFTLLLASCSSIGHEEVVERMYDEAWGGGNMGVVDEFVSPDYRWIENARPGAGRTSYKALIDSYRSAFPDLTYTIHQKVSDGELMAIRWTARGTHRGAMMGIPATRQVCEVRGTTFCRFDDGVLVEEWTTWDEAGMLRQMGVMP